MPELPEVETVRRTLAATLLGQRVVAARLRRRDVVEGDATQAALLTGRQFTDILRLGKQLALVAALPDSHAAGNGDRAGDVPRCVNVHLGMTGSLRHLGAAVAADSDNSPGDHVHLTWRLDDGSRLLFRDPRRFGGVWTFDSVAALRAARWGQLGPDALVITPAELHERLGRTRRAIKAALLDQALVAGLGNIYVDELLFAAGVHPATPADRLALPAAGRLVRCMRRLLAAAIKSGGSTLRDYVDATGRAGRYQSRHRVYGRQGEPCRRCRSVLSTATLGGRTTVYCPACQHDS